MKFDIVFGNPPYQEMDGGGGVTKSSLPLYHKFINFAITIKAQYITMIIPARWLCGGKQALDDFRNQFILDKHLSKLVIYKKCWDVFETVDIPGGILYFLYDKDYNSSECEVVNIQTKINYYSKNIRNLSKYTYTDPNGNRQIMIIGDNKGVSIIDKVLALGEPRMELTVLPRSAFGIDSYFTDSDIKDEKHPIKVVCSNGRETYSNLTKLSDKFDVLNKYKVIVGKVNPDRGGNNNSELYNVISRPIIVNPGEACTTTFLILNTFDNKEDAENFISYLSTKLVRFLAYLTLSGTSMSNRNYMFIPVTSESKKWADEELYEKYRLSQEDIEYINLVIKNWN